MIFNSYTSTIFSTSITCMNQLKCDNNIEIAFIGYSNVGKSSMINFLTNQHKLARVSKTPGSTRTINFFKIAKKKYLVDLPGYGYSNFSQNLKNTLKKLIIKYLIYRKSLKAVVLLVDIRRSFRKEDYTIINILNKKNLPILITLTKSDKFSKSIRERKMFKIKKECLLIHKKVSVILFSSTLHLGIFDVKNFLSTYYNT
ncbi:ribosome biogenesis GTP-binding protein YihA/YsxC [Buchnera aphidicola]|nr:ribosome biogenesis GTP-binding protein YihA/YsxC [Buchnera aphidicola]